MKEVKEREAELAQKYRDRAKERRENKAGENEEELVSTTANFRAVAPNFNSDDNADRRRQIIEESKYLGGDLEHTHLVKGLDYALLQKVRAELEKEQLSDNDLDDEDEEKSKLKERADEREEKSDAEEEEEEEPESSKDKLKFSLKPKLLTKSDAAAIAASLSKGKGILKLDNKKK